MEALDIGLVWTPEGPAPGQPGYAAGDPLPTSAGCAGRVLASGVMRYGEIGWTYRTEIDPVTGSLMRLITGASYVSMLPQLGAGFGDLAGMRAVLGGGGKMFGAKNRTGVAVYPYRMIDKRDAVLKHEVKQAELVWPDWLIVNGTEYAQIKGNESLVYQGESGEVLDLETHNRQRG